MQEYLLEEQIREMHEEIAFAIDDCISYITLAIDEVKKYPYLKILKEDLETMLEVAKDKQKEWKNEDNKLF